MISKLTHYQFHLALVGETLRAREKEELKAEIRARNLEELVSVWPPEYEEIKRAKASRQ